MVPNPSYPPVNSFIGELKPSFSFCLIVGLVITLPTSLRANEKREKEFQTVEFNRDIRPILVEHCYACHGPDESSRQAELRLDLKESFLATEDSVIKPGRPELSELFKRVSSTDPDFQMPPPSYAKQLSAKQKKQIGHWIKSGAEFQKHWAYEKPVGAKLPQVKFRRWPRNPIDVFVLRQMEKRGLSPSPQADRETLIRRVTLDLTGLPPTPKQVEAFLADQKPDAYERLVDSLMGTVEYAERRAQDWLDLARYADSRGFADDQSREIWPYRDWVIRSIDENMPYDQFTIEQLAGDLLPNATSEQRLATAFHRNAPQAKGETYPVEQYRIKGVIDRVNTTAKVWLGLTYECAECHDHKFDPITQRDFYSMVAVFNQIEHSGRGFKQGGPTMQYRPPTANRSTNLFRQQKIKKALAEALGKLPPAGTMDESKVIGTWKKTTTVRDSSKLALKGNLTITATIQTKQQQASLVSNYDWRAKQRGFVFGIGGEGEPEATSGNLFFWVSSKADPFQGITVYGSLPVNDDKEHQVAVEFVAGKSVRLFVDGVEDLGAAKKGEVPSSINVPDRALAIGAGYKNSEKANAFLYVGDRFQVRLSDQPQGDQISVGAAAAEAQALQKDLAKVNSLMARDGLEVKVPVMKEMTDPRKTYVHVRGNFLRKGKQVQAAYPSLFHTDTSGDPPNRLSFAKWLVNGQNPLVARVAVNRYWQTYFGEGLVRTVDDFGAHGAPPTHPELLDWLATEFVGKNWNRKHIHRLIVTSSTYRQSSRINKDSFAKDPQNLWLSHLPRIRLPAEQLRDQALAVSGLLAKRTGGPPVFPQQTKDYWEQRVLPGTWKESSGDDRNRRSIYTYWRRMALHPSLETLNAPSRSVCVVKREVSNTPNQALILLNDPIFHEAANALAVKLCRKNENDDATNIKRAFRMVLGRDPSRAESKRFTDFLMMQRKLLANDIDALENLAPAANQNNRIKISAWTLAASVLLNLDETLIRK